MEIETKKPEIWTNLEGEVSKIKEKDQEPAINLSWVERPPKIAKKKEKNPSHRRSFAKI